jgi:hypothetical protein
MSNLWGRDSRIDDGTAMRDLEKKVHFLMQQMLGSGIVATRGVNIPDVPQDIDDDGNEVFASYPTDI